MIRSLPAAIGASALLILLAIFAPVSEENGANTSHSVSIPRAARLAESSRGSIFSDKANALSPRKSLQDESTDNAVNNHNYKLKTIIEASSLSEEPSILGSQLSQHQNLVVAGRRKAWLDYETALQVWSSKTTHEDDEEGLALSDSQPVAPPWICFTEGVSPAFIESIGANRSVPAPAGITGKITPLAFQYFSNSRWTRTASNPPPLSRWRRADKIVLTWGIVPDGTMAPGLSGHPDNSNPAPSNLRSRLNEIYGSESIWIEHFQSVFDSWAERAGVRYIYQAQDDGAALPSAPGILFVRPDIRISGRALDGDFGVVATNYSPNSGDMIIDTSDAFFENLANNSILFRNTIAHEHGHALGLAHVCPIDSTKLMEPHISTAFDGPQTDDTFSAQRSYGDAYEDRDSDVQAEDNDRRARATDLGVFPPSTKTIRHLSIDDNGDTDFYKISPPASNSALRVSLRPIGGNYLEGAQNSNGVCSPGSNFAAGSVHNLNFAILDSAGNIIANADSQPAGTAESVGAFFPPAGDLTIRVKPSTNTNRVQLYDLDITFIDPATFPVISAATKSQSESDGTMLIEVSKTGQFPETVSVNYSLESISATAHQDFTPVTGTLTFHDSTISQEIHIPLINDASPEIDETFLIRLSDPIFARVPIPTGTMTILDDDARLLLEETAAVAFAPNGRATLSWSTVPGRTYRVEYCEDMTNWTPLPGAAAIVADEAVESITDLSASGAPRRFYRLVDSP